MSFFKTFSEIVGFVAAVSTLIETGRKLVFLLLKKHTDTKNDESVEKNKPASPGPTEEADDTLHE